MNERRWDIGMCLHIGAVQWAPVVQHCGLYQYNIVQSCVAAMTIEDLIEF